MTLEIFPEISGEFQGPSWGLPVKMDPFVQNPRELNAQRPSFPSLKAMVPISKPCGARWFFFGGEEEPAPGTLPLGIQSYCQGMIGVSNHWKVPLPFLEGDWIPRIQTNISLSVVGKMSFLFHRDDGSFRG